MPQVDVQRKLELSINFTKTGNDTSPRGFSPHELNDVDMLLKHPWSPTIFRDGYKCLDNFMYQDYGALDFDDATGFYPLEQAMLEWQDSRCIIGTTRSHTNENHCFRILFVWEKRIENPTLARFNNQYLIKNYGGDASCAEESRLYYPFKEIIMVGSGDFLQPVIPTPKGWVDAKINEILNYRKYRQYAAYGAIPPQVAYKLKNGAPEGEKDNACYWAAKILRYCGKAPELIESEILNSPIPMDNRRSKMEARRAVRNGIKKAEKIIAAEKTFAG